jgi:hypothetical protein
MTPISQIKDHMDVVGSDDRHVGTVDHIEGEDRIKLTRSDPDAGSQHHYIPVDWVDRVDDRVHLSMTAKDAKAQWH